MKASEVTESGFYWWKAPGHLEDRGIRSGWQPILAEVDDGVVACWIIGEEVVFLDDDLEGELIGPMHDPERTKRKWSIWSEGYAVTGNEAPAQWLGDREAATFAEACAIWADTCSDPGSFNRHKLTYWGCRLFDNEADARERFG